MSTNLYINNHGASNEQQLLNDLVRENIQFHGIDVIYAPRTIVKEDLLFGEDVLSAFNEAFQIEMYIESAEAFGGEGDVIAKFGLEVKDEINLQVHKDRFELVTGMSRPLEGDLIYFPLSNGLFEIKYVEHENPFYQHGKLYQYNLTCELFVYSQEDLTTGVSAIDKVQTEYDTTSDDVSQDPYASNTPVQTEADSILDFSESNPFGDNP